MTKVGSYAIGTSTTLESNKSLGINSKVHFGADGGGAADDVEVMVAFMHALTGTQRVTRPEGVPPPRLWRSRDVD
jgi:hypothetical protein